MYVRISVMCTVIIPEKLFYKLQFSFQLSSSQSLQAPGGSQACRQILIARL